MIANIAKYKISDFADGFAGISPTNLQYIPDQLERVSSGEWWDSLLGAGKPDFSEDFKFYILYRIGGKQSEYWESP